MTLNKGFLKNKITVFNLNKKQVIIGSVIFFLIAISFFNFLHIIRLFGLFFDSMFNTYEPLIFSKEGEFFYNLLFGFISVNFSFSLVYNFWFEKPNSFLSRYNYKRKLALNQQRTLNWFLIYWFLKLAFMFGFLTSSFSQQFIFFNYKKIIWIFIFAFIGQIWISIRPLTKKNKFKWFLIVVFTCLSFSFIVSKINIINPVKIQNKLVHKNLMFKNDIRIVESKVGTKIMNEYLSCDIIISNNNEILFEGKKVNVNKLLSKVFGFKNLFSESEAPFIKYVLFIDRNVKMKKVYDIKKKLNEINIKRIVFSTKEIGNKKPFYYKSKYGLGMYLPSNFINRKNGDINQEIRVKILNNKKYLFKNDTISERNLTKTFKVYFQKEGTKSFRVFYSKENTFEEYFKVLEHSKEAVNILRNTYSKNAYGVDFEKLNRIQKRPIKEKYRWHIIDEIY